MNTVRCKRRDFLKTVGLGAAAIPSGLPRTVTW